MMRNFAMRSQWADGPVGRTFDSSGEVRRFEPRPRALFFSLNSSNGWIMSVMWRDTHHSSSSSAPRHDSEIRFGCPSKRSDTSQYGRQVLRQSPQEEKGGTDIQTNATHKISNSQFKIIIVIHSKATKTRPSASADTMRYYRQYTFVN